MRYINFNQLRSFHAVATAGNVTNAAKLLNISQPTVTTQLKQLEERYDVELVHRSHRGIKLSPLGRALHQLTMRIFSLEEEALDIFDMAQNLERGVLQIGSVGPHFVMNQLARFNREFPGVRITLISGNSDEILEKLFEFQIDVGIVGNIKPHPALSIHLLEKYDVVLVVNADHRWAKVGSVSIEDLHGADLIMREQGSETRRVLEAEFEKADVEPNIVMEVDRDALKEAALEGFGAGIVSEAEIRHDDDLNIVRFSNASVYTEAFIVCLKEREEKRLIKTLISMINNNNSTR